MNKMFRFILFFALGTLAFKALADVKFKIQIHNHTQGDLSVVCKTITGYQKWVFSKGRVVVPAHSLIIEPVEIPRVSQHPNEEIQCTYSGKGILSGSAWDKHASTLRIEERTTDSVAVNASFGGTLRLVINPAVSKITDTEAVLDTHSEFLMASENL